VLRKLVLEPIILVGGKYIDVLMTSPLINRIYIVFELKVIYMVRIGTGELYIFVHETPKLVEV
jgi:hypothetical protein